MLVRQTSTKIETVIGKKLSEEIEIYVNYSVLPSFLPVSVYPNKRSILGRITGDVIRM